MQNIRSICITLCLIVLLLSPLSIAAQTNCSLRNGGADAGGDGSVDQRVSQYCSETPTDVHASQGPDSWTCIACEPGTTQHPPAFTHGGVQGCTNFSKQMLITFAQPVANVEWEVYGARTITDNRGYTVRMNPALDADGVPIGSVVAKFPGGGITSLTISDPIEYDVWDHFSSPEVLRYRGFWEINSWNTSWTSNSVFQACNCSRPTFSRPLPQTFSSPDWDNNGVPDWRMDVEVSDNDGLVLRNVTLENRYMAEKISVPYYTLETSAVTPAQRGELKPAGADASLRSRLVNYQSWSDAEKLVVEATYVIDQIPAGSTNCLQVIQHYEFYKRRVGCEPSDTLPCSPWKPIVQYKYFGSSPLVSITIPQRFHFAVNGFQDNSVGLFRDCDSTLRCLFGGGYVFRDKFNPLDMEWNDRVIAQGQDASKWDNFHQTFKQDVEEPAEFPHFWSPGCPECMHLHWRWAANLGQAFGSGVPLLSAATNQDVDIAVTKFHTSEDDPLDYTQLGQEPETIRVMKYPDWDSRFPLWAQDNVVFWYSSTGHKSEDTFFPTPGAFFNPSYHGDTAPITPSAPLGALAKSAAAKRAKGNSVILSVTEDHPESVKFDYIYEDGATTFTTVDPNTLGPLPAGYALYSDDVYDISTAAVVSGSHVVTFSVPSITDQTLFGNLRVLQIEPDSFDPSIGRLVDRTILSPATPAPDFANHHVSAQVNGLGVFVLATLIQPPPPPNTDVADLALTVTGSPPTVLADNDVTYTVTVTNNGPQTANELLLRDTLAPEAHYTAATPSQGTCKAANGTVVCNLNSLASTASATVSIVAHVEDPNSSIPAAGKRLNNVAVVGAKEHDNNLANNSVFASTTVLPGANAAPAVSITSPLSGDLFAGPAMVGISMTASDSDGTVSTVEVYENDNPLGTASLTAPSQYQLTWNNASYGSHVLVAVATDNLGKKRASKPVNIIVNGPASVSIVSPGNWTNFNKPANITVTATASVAGGSITKVDFYGDGFLVGTGTLTGTNTYSLTWNSVSSGKHLLACVATDNLGLTSTSQAINVTVNDPPVISIVSPAAGATFVTLPANIPITANASDWDGYVVSVSFYANGTLVGTQTPAGVNQFPFTWSNVATGTYSLTAVATDNYNATTTSAPVIVRVNAPPSLTITSPSNGAQFAAPANITLNATASDSDGAIASVVFSANGTSIGTATPLGGNQYSLSWSSVQFGSYAISAVATDNDGGIVSVGSVTISVTSPALFVTGSTTLTTSDAAVKTRLEALGHVVTVKDATTVTTADATGKALVVISSTVNPTSVNTKFRTVTVPVLTWESGLLNNMGMTGSTNKDFGTKTGQTQITITNASHFLAAGLTGTATVTTAAKTFNWGKPNANAISIATIAADSAKTAIFGYEPGVAMPGLTAPARRLALFLGDDTAEVLNTGGVNLLDAAIKWTRGGGSLSGSKVASPASVDLTATGVLDWAHWGRSGPTSFDHKSGVTQRITDVTKIGAGGLSWFSDCPTAFSWTNGTPTLSASNTTTGINTNGVVGNGFEISVPADRTLEP